MLFSILFQLLQHQDQVADLWPLQYKITPLLFQFIQFDICAKFGLASLVTTEMGLAATS